MHNYEMVMILSPEKGDDEVAAAIERVGRFITDRGGSVEEVNQWGKRRLAYPIKHFVEGNYILTHFKLDPNLTAELEAGLRISEDVLRHLLVRLED